MTSESVTQLVDALSAQYELLNRSEEIFELYKVVKDITQIFWMEEFSFLGDLPIYQSQKTWIGGVSVKNIFQGIYSFLSKYQYFVKDKIANMDEKAKFQDEPAKDGGSNAIFMLDEQP